jgi:hypothetical protein
MTILPLLAACSFHVPLDPDAPTPTNTISGTVVADTAGSPTFVLLFAADDPPPPTGTGSPVTFSSIPASAFTGDGQGLQSAPFAITGVPDGNWLITALLDADGDFQPLLSSNAGATCGDWVGAHITDLTTGDFAPVTVEGGETLDDVPVLVGRELTTERPAFTIAEGAIDQTSEDMQSFTLASTGIHSEVVDLDGPYDPDAPAACQTSFLVYINDADGDGQPDPHPNPDLAAAGALDIWPRIYVQYAGEVPDGESWATEAVIFPDFLFTGEVSPGVPTPRTSLTAIFTGAAVHTLADGTQEVVYAPDLPPGPWSVTVVSITGQTWTLPNETAGFPSTSDDFDPTTQGATLIVQ